MGLLILLLRQQPVGLPEWFREAAFGDLPVSWRGGRRGRGGGLGPGCLNGFDPVIGSGAGAAGRLCRGFGRMGGNLPGGNTGAFSRWTGAGLRGFGVFAATLGRFSWCRWEDVKHQPIDARSRLFRRQEAMAHHTVRGPEVHLNLGAVR